MQAYNNDKPLILIHIPKTAGVSVKEIYQRWFSDRLYFHYYDGKTKKNPIKHDLSVECNQVPAFVYGHFNRSKGFGIEHYYSEVEQFITILRDPFEMAVSGYFYVRKTNPDWRVQLKLKEGGLHEYLSTMHSGLLNFFPCEITVDNYKAVIETKFVEIGITEHLDESMQRIAKKLGQYYAPNSIRRLNIATRDQHVPYELKQDFMQRHTLEFAIYNYVLDKYK